MRRETQNILLVLLGGALLKIAFNGSYLRYVKPTLFPWLVSAGAGMVLLAVVSIVRDVVATRRSVPVGHGGVEIEPGESAESESRTPDEHGHHHSSRSPWMLLLPVLAIFLVAPPALGADSVNRSAGRTVAGQQGSSGQKSTGGGAMFPALPAGDVVPLGMSDFVTRAVWDETHSLEHRTVTLTGFAVHDGRGVYVARLVITCCAADSTPVKVKLAGGDLRGLKNDQWIQVTGQVQMNTANEANEYVPTFTVSSIQQVVAPEDPYES